MSTFTDSAPAVTCNQVSIDPTNWVKVEFIGHIGTHQNVDIVVLRGGNPLVALHDVTADISQYTSDQHGSFSYQLQAFGNFGPYGTFWSQTATGELDCDPPATSTTTVPKTVTTVDVPTTVVRIGTPATLQTPHRTTVAPVATTAPPKELPMTGNNAGFGLAAGGSAILVGAILLRLGRWLDRRAQ